MSNLSTLPKGDSAWLLRKAIERIIQQVSVLETNIGASTTGNSANTQVIFNDNGTLRGDPDLTFNKALNKLVATNLESTTTLVVGTSAAITGALTVTGAANLNGAVNLSLAGTATVTLGASSSYGLLVGSGANAASIYINGATAANASKLLYGASQHEWYNSSLSSLIATLNTTGLGIGVASPATKLDVRGANNASQATFSGTASRGLLISTRNDGLADDRTVILNAQHSTGALGQLVIQTAGTDRLLVDNAGNVGIGVTPSAWGSNYTPVELTKGACIYGAKNIPYTIVGANVYNDATSEKYTISPNTAATKYQQTGGVHSWHNAVAGTINTAITFTQAMTLDASGRLGIGTATPGETLDVKGTGNFNNTSGTYLGFQTNAAQVGYIGTANTILTGGLNTELGLYANSSLVIATGASALQRLRVEAAGDVTISTGNVVMATSGKGIDFSAVTGGTGTATGNVLNDYEEGTWVPSVGGDATYTLRRANYVKVGRLVTVSWDMEILLIGTGDVSGIISLPFVVGTASGLNNQPGYGACGFFNVLATTVYSMTFYAAANTSTIYAMTKNSLSAGNSVNTAIYGNGSRVQGSLTYMTNS